MSKPKNNTIRLRRSVRKNGSPGGWKLRISLSRGRAMKSYLLEVGLHTRDADEARRRGDIVVRAFEAAGLHANPPLRVSDYNLAQQKGIDSDQGMQLTLF